MGIRICIVHVPLMVGVKLPSGVPPSASQKAW